MNLIEKHSRHTQPFSALCESWNYPVQSPHSLSDRVYRLSHVSDDPRFRGIELNCGIDPIEAIFDNPKATVNSLVVLTKKWNAPKITARIAPWNDCPMVGLFPAFSSRAVECLADLLTPHGELLPLGSGRKKYFVYVAAIHQNLLDRKKSVIDRSFTLGRRRVAMIDRHEFNTKLLVNYPIFRIPQRRRDTFVTDAFVQRVKHCGLVGFNFDIVFPLSVGDNWRKMASKIDGRHLRERMPGGKSMCSRQVRIRFKLRDRDDIPTPRQEKQVERWGAAVENKLVDLRTITSPVGFLDGVALEVGEIIAVFSGPDADVLRPKLQSMLSMIKWRGEVVIAGKKH